MSDTTTLRETGLAVLQAVRVLQVRALDEGQVLPADGETLAIAVADFEIAVAAVPATSAVAAEGQALVQAVTDFLAVARREDIPPGQLLKQQAREVDDRAAALRAALAEDAAAPAEDAAAPAEESA